MADTNPINHAIALPTFIGSLLSFLGSATALGFQIARPPARHFRHSLIVNLLIAGNISQPACTMLSANFQQIWFTVLAILSLALCSSPMAAHRVPKLPQTRHVSSVAGSASQTRRLLISIFSLSLLPFYYRL